MTRSFRTLVGGAGMILFVMFYALAAMALADSRPVQQSNLVVQVIVYIVLGFAWILPLMPVISWMEGGRRRARKGGARAVLVDVQPPTPVPQPERRAGKQDV